jgi:hypothetical protein
VRHAKTAARDHHSVDDAAVPNSARVPFECEDIFLEDFQDRIDRRCF